MMPTTTNPTPAEIAALERRIAEGVMGWEQSYPGSPRPLSDSWKDSNGDTRYIGVPLDKDRHLYWSPWNDPAAALEILERLANGGPYWIMRLNSKEFEVGRGFPSDERGLRAESPGPHYGPAVCLLAEKVINMPR